MIASRIGLIMAFLIAGNLSTTTVTKEHLERKTFPIRVLLTKDRVTSGIVLFRIEYNRLKREHDPVTNDKDPIRMVLRIGADEGSVNMEVKEANHAVFIGEFAMKPKLAETCTVNIWLGNVLMDHVYKVPLKIFSDEMKSLIP